MKTDLKPTPQSIIANIKRATCDEIKEKLQNIDDSEEIYFHDIVHSILDRNTPTDPKLCHAIMCEFMTNEDYENVDEGLIDKSSPKRILITSTYVALENELFKDNFFVGDLQDGLNNEIIEKKHSYQIIKNIDSYLRENKLLPQTFEDSDLQVFITVGEKLKLSDFEEPYFHKKQMIDLHDDIKILTNNYETNKNAIVCEYVRKEKEGFRYRIYLMDKSKGLDIRQFMIKYSGKETIGSHNGYNLDPKHYINSFCSHFPGKKALIYTLNQMCNSLVELGDKEHDGKHRMVR
jgi:hypothetical protein